jgi:hypothetical protein
VAYSLYYNIIFAFRLYMRMYYQLCGGKAFCVVRWRDDVILNLSPSIFVNVRVYFSKGTTLPALRQSASPKTSSQSSGGKRIIEFPLTSTLIRSFWGSSSIEFSIECVRKLSFWVQVQSVQIFKNHIFVVIIDLPPFRYCQRI